MTISTNPHLRHPHPRPSPRGGYPCPGCPGLSHEEGRRALDATTPGEGRSPPFFRSARRGGREWAPVVWLIVAMRAYIGERGVGREGERGPRGRESGGREGVPVTKREKDRFGVCLYIFFVFYRQIVS